MSTLTAEKMFSAVDRIKAMENAVDLGDGSKKAATKTCRECAKPFCHDFKRGFKEFLKRKFCCLKCMTINRAKNAKAGPSKRVRIINGRQYVVDRTHTPRKNWDPNPEETKRRAAADAYRKEWKARQKRDAEYAKDNAAMVGEYPGETVDLRLRALLPEKV